MTTDRELLELAANAAGGKVEWRTLLGKDALRADFGEGFEPWNPLTDDGARYRLARTLKMVVDFDAETVLYPLNGKWEDIDDSNISLERKIVRAAAEIGRNMK